MVAKIVAGAVGMAIGAASEKFSIPIPRYSDFAPGNAQIEKQAFQIFEEEIIKHEGWSNTVYADSLGKPTVGIGHLVLPIDNLKMGDKISNEKVQQLFEQDAASAFNAAKKQAKEIARYNAQMIAALASVNYQLGVYWYTKFPTTWALIKTGNAQSVQKAIQGLLVKKYDSKGNPLTWYAQTPNRVEAFVQVLQNQFA